ncbi:MAG: rhomboid family intramembrane serine protease [Gemmatales bacterium]|nr:MAG: rhomboid family intramembrane serine protease [Gemmatales bacterium]
MAANTEERRKAAVAFAMIPIQDTIRSRDLPFVTWLLIFLNGLFFLQELALSPDHLRQLVEQLGLVPARLVSDPWSWWWTLITCMFLHGGWMHFVGNMWMLYLFGDNVEDRMGPVAYLFFYLLCGIAASLGQVAVSITSTIPTIGASGAISGVLGAYFVLFPRARILTLVPVIFLPLIVEVPATVFIGVWFFSQLFSGTLALVEPEYFNEVAWWAHIGGFVAGMVLVPIFKKPPSRYRAFYEDEYWPW